MHFEFSVFLHYLHLLGTQTFSCLRNLDAGFILSHRVNMVIFKVKSTTRYSEIQVFSSLSLGCQVFNDYFSQKSERLRYEPHSPDALMSHTLG
ncbi:hypothetical protein MATL_G00012240 [Megalops atlanticus]|uniref:Secreted protein n=1 Tax=Megalops atlanticus TaxID=7932 RepID=A0A9D3QI80_MEGAT|nr:hypothetical protein MATL_G00012240 [Megalops atlanticus]